MYFAYKSGGWRRQLALWELVNAELLVLYALTEDDARWMQVLMAQYHDGPMDVADASLVAASGALGERRVFTLDSDFYVYRSRGGQPLEVVP